MATVAYHRADVRGADIAYAQTSGRAYVERQDDLIRDYRTNVALYPEFQRSLRDTKMSLLARWGADDPSFVPADAEAFLRTYPTPRCTCWTRGTSRWSCTRLRSPR